MADTSTLRPISTRDRAALTPQDDAAVLAQALERFRQASDAEAQERAQQLEALRFRSGDHSVAAMRGAGGEAYPAPTMTVDRQSAFLKQTVNAYRRAPLSIRVRPKAGGATKQVADVLGGQDPGDRAGERSRGGVYRGLGPGRWPGLGLFSTRDRMGRPAQL